MDKLAITGLVVGLGAVYYTMHIGGIASLLFNKEAFILVAGGTAGATMLTYRWETFRLLPMAVRMMFVPPKTAKLDDLIDTIMRFREQAGTGGIDSIRNDIGTLENEFMATGMRMLIEGLPAETIVEEMDIELNALDDRHQRLISMFRSMGAYSPIFGMLGTLIGVIQVLRDLSDATRMGTSMAIAITTTFYGIFACNFLFLPVAGKLEGFHQSERAEKELIIEGILAIRRNELPILIRRRLSRFLAGKERAKGPS
jgi:chemotaxis protein MotA